MPDIYVPDVSGTVTLADLRSAVNRKLRNFLFWSTYKDVGDGERSDFMMPSGGIVENTMTVSVSGVVTAPSSIDLDSGWVAFSSAPAADAELIFRYQCQLWDDDDVLEALNTAIRYFAPRFAVEDSDSTVIADGSSFEYAVPDTVGYISRIDVLSSGSTQYLKMHQGWETYTTGSTKYVRFFTAPATSSTLRILFYRKPGFLSDDEDTLEVNAHIAPEARDAVVFWACSVLLLDVVGGRVSDANYVSTDATNTVRLLDVQRASDAFASRAEMAAESCRATPLPQRV